MNFKAVQKRETIYKNGHSPLFLRFTHEKKSKFLSLGVSVLSEHWEKMFFFIFIIKTYNLLFVLCFVL